MTAQQIKEQFCSFLNASSQGQGQSELEQSLELKKEIGIEGKVWASAQSLTLNRKNSAPMVGTEFF